MLRRKCSSFTGIVFGHAAIDVVSDSDITGLPFRAADEEVNPAHDWALLRAIGMRYAGRFCFAHRTRAKNLFCVAPLPERSEDARSRIGPGGFEPPTSCAQGRRANQAALRPEAPDHITPACR